MGISERIKMIRGEEAQGQFALKIGAHQNTIGRWERGERIPDQVSLCKILERYPDINPAWLLTGEGPMKGFTASVQPAPIAPESLGAKGELVVSEDTLELISEILDEKMGDRAWEINSDKTMILIKTLHRFYSRNFIESAKFRRDTMEKNIESLVKLALPD